MYGPRATLTLTTLAFGAIVLVASLDATARTHHTRSRIHAPSEMTELFAPDRAPRAKVRVRARKRGTTMSVKFRRLEPNAEHVVLCEALGDEPIPFVTNDRGRARLRGVPVNPGSRGDSFEIDVHDPDGFVVLEGELEHPGDHAAHADKQRARGRDHTRGRDDDAEGNGGHRDDGHGHDMGDHDGDDHADGDHMDDHADDHDGDDHSAGDHSDDCDGDHRADDNDDCDDDHMIGDHDDHDRGDDHSRNHMGGGMHHRR